MTRGDGWTDANIALLERLWCVDGLSASKCAAALGRDFTRNAVIGKVHRLKLEKRGSNRKDRTARTGPSSPAAPRGERKGRNGSSGKYGGLVAAVRKARAAGPKPLDPPPPDVFTPDPAQLAVGAWNALPGTTPVTLGLLARDGCRWPIGEDAPFLFCGCKAAAGSSYCATHKHRAQGVGTPSEQSAVKSAKSMVRMETSYGFRSNQAGQSL